MLRPSTWIAILCLALLTGCASMVQGLAPEYRTMQSGSQPYSYQTAAFVYSFANGNNHQWVSTLEMMDKDAIPTLEKLRGAGHDVRIEIHPKQAPGSDYEYYDVMVQVVPKGQSDAVLMSAATQQTGIEAQELSTCDRTIQVMVNMMTGLNVASDTMQRRAFALLVTKKKLESGEKADQFDPNRPKEEAIADIDLALRLVASDHQRIQEARVGVLALTALTERARTTESIELLRQQVADSRAGAKRWLATHQQPTADDFGVKPAALPSAESMMADLQERAGFIGAVLQVAKGVATGSPSATLEGLSKLAPKDSSARVALEGLSAAAEGNVQGTVDAIAKLGGADQELETVRSRLRQADQLSALKREADRRSAQR